MRTIEVTETDLNQLVGQTAIIDEVLLVHKGEQVARLVPPIRLTAGQHANHTTALSEPPSHFIVAQAGDAMEREIAAYEALHQELLRDHLGQYVAIYQGAVVDCDDDRAALRRRLNTMYPGCIMLVRQVKPTLPGAIHIRSPKLSRG